METQFLVLSLCTISFLVKEKMQENYDVLIVVDCSNSVRTKGFASYSNLAKKIIVIDHHESLAHLISSDYSIVDATASSCTCIIFREFLNFISNNNLTTFLKYILLAFCLILLI